MLPEIIFIKFSHAIAGMLGWFAVFMVDKDLHWRDGIALVIIGGICSYYLVPAMVGYFGLSVESSSFLAFFTWIMARSVIIEAKKRLTKVVVDKAENMII